jgi:long-chain acyl-CoA synthetase
MYSGDMGSMDEDGFIYFKQRIKRMIVSSGYNIYPQYIENIIDSHPDLLMSCVIGIEHDYKGQVAKAYIVLKKGVEASQEEKNKIRKYCEKKLVRYSWPYEYEFRDELPMVEWFGGTIEVMREEEGLTAYQNGKRIMN